MLELMLIEMSLSVLL